MAEQSNKQPSTNAKTKRPLVNIYTDGSCVPPVKDGKAKDSFKNGFGCGGWAFVIVNNDPRYNYCIGGGEPHTTVPRMELTAAYKAICYVSKPSYINIYSDSEYVVEGLKNLARWESRDWKTQNNKPVKNSDLWKAILDKIRSSNHVVFSHWVKGHNGNPLNEAVDKLARFHSCLMRNELQKHHLPQVLKDLEASRTAMTRRTRDNNYLGLPRNKKSNAKK